MSEQQDDSGAEAFQNLAALLDYPMFVVTTTAGDHPSGCLVGFTSQTSINPPRFLVGLSRKNHTFKVAQDAEHLAVHLLPRDELALAALFGEKTGDTTDKFTQCAWHSGPEGMPILDAAPAWFVGQVIRRFDLGDHVGHLVEPVAGSAPDELGDLITFSDVRDLEPGHDA
jgi:flavin reductase (DIM6/NTAB) family NADH-FMN oxidoreductase RutF